MVVTSSRQWQFRAACGCDTVCAGPV